MRLINPLLATLGHAEVSCAGCTRRDELRVSRRRPQQRAGEHGMLYLPAGIE